jgi:hypothetical protein
MSSSTLYTLKIYGTTGTLLQITPGPSPSDG